MSKKKSRSLSKLGVVLIGACLLCVTSLTMPIAVAQQPTVAEVNPKTAGVVAATDEVLRETSEIRKLEALRPVKSAAQSRAEIERALIKNMDEDTSPAELRASELTMKRLGLVPANFQLRSFLIKLLVEQVAGYYDPRTRQFYLADWIDLDGQKPVMAHELTHALQDQHFDLNRFEKWPKGDSDAELAAHALVEGDATLVMSFYIMRDMTRAKAMLKSMTMGGSSSEQIDHAPRALRDTLLFPYEQGLTWVSQVYRRGGWPLVSQAFTDLPKSSEQILHPEKYFAHEAPLKIDLVDLSATLGANWKRIQYDVNGEWNYFEILDQFLKSDEESHAAAAGWGGDRYALYENAKNGQTVLMQLAAWDTEKDARDFFNAYAKRTNLRYQNEINASSNPNDAVHPDERSWTTTEGIAYLERRGTQVFIVEGLPKQINPYNLRKRIWPASVK